MPSRVVRVFEFKTPAVESLRYAGSRAPKVFTMSLQPMPAARDAVWVPTVAAAMHAAEGRITAHQAVAIFLKSIEDIEAIHTAMDAENAAA